MHTRKIFRIPDRSRRETDAVLETKRIAVTGAGRGTGVSLIAGLLAASFCRREGQPTALVELGTPYFYEAVGMERRFLHRDFHLMHRLVAQHRSIQHLANVEEGINWVLRHPKDGLPDVQNGQAAAIEALRLVHNVAGGTVIFDCSGLPGEWLRDILPDMDFVVCVIDPMPTCLIPAAGDIDRIRLDAPQPVFVVNKMNRGVHRGEVKRFLQGIDWAECPLLEASDLYRAQYNCVLPYSLPGVKRATVALLLELSRRLDHRVAPPVTGLRGKSGFQ